LERKELGKVTTGITVHDERSVGGRGIGFAFAFAYPPPTFHLAGRRLYPSVGDGVRADDEA
jgi:hypothetical protein